MDALGLYDIYEYHYQPFWHTYAFKAGVIGCGVLLIMGVMWYIFRSFFPWTTVDQWSVWRKNLATLRTRPVTNALFYATVAQIIKECALLKLCIPKSLTDLELALLLKSSNFPESVQSLSKILERAYVYKFDPVYNEHVIQEKEIEIISNALQVMQQMPAEK